MIEKDTIYKVIVALRELAVQKDGDEKMLLVGSANFMEEMIRNQENEDSKLCLCPERFGDCEYYENGKCNSKLI